MTLDPPIRACLAPNPSPLTGRGTNTWIVGATGLAVIDPGPDDPAHLTAILSMVGPGQRIDRIIVTHAHLDHSALARRLGALTGASVLAFGIATEGRSPLMSRLAPDLPTHGEGLDLDFVPDLRLADGEEVTGPDWTLTAIHTPGHLGGHLCLALGETLFSGDHVMGWSTTIVSPPDGDMAAYMASLARLAQARWSRFLPGHGDPIPTPDLRLQDLITHRLSRESQILAALGDNPARIPALTARIYADIPRHLLPAAERNVLAHLIDLATRNCVIASPALLPDAEFRLP
ncbi:MAG: MBL fold metallo-hydrolase [Tabrizicola sp.]|jgi:glyoxylase-like metal-dependent hydrolase (beta-lactamase superfamily II)|nr:MBL fold metallo-hydrolase [Tabrizicola sp.]